MNDVDAGSSAANNDAPGKPASRLMTYLMAGIAVPLLVEVLAGVLFTLIAFLAGDTKSHHISGSPALDSPSMPWYLHWHHELTYHFVLLTLVSLAIAAIAAVLRGPYRPRSSSPGK